MRGGAHFKLLANMGSDLLFEYFTYFLNFVRLSTERYYDISILAGVINQSFRESNPLPD